MGATRVLDRTTIAGRLADFPRVAAERPELKQAAVAVCVTEHEGAPALVLTRRAARLRAHAGQWALPGGRRDPGETAVAGALREVREEIGLDLAETDVLGLLDDYVTRSGYVMTPVVCRAGRVGELVSS
jgi:8-oxo-dGTP pyrophosphatase MutT (NUDIX family)